MYHILVNFIFFQLLNKLLNPKFDIVLVMIILGNTLKKVREAKGLSQKELAGFIDMAQAQYSRIENGKTDPSFSVVIKIVKALGVNFSELFKADELFNEENTIDKTIVEKIHFLDSLDDVEKKSIYTLIDSLIAKKKLKDNLQSLANL
jgi:transcriptional regulator with XRE-family HTH domain